MSPTEARAAAAPDDDLVFSIQQVSRLLDVPPPTLRSWERRYGVALANRSIGGHRRYSSDEVELLRRMRDAITAGRRTGEAATWVKEQPSESPTQLVEAFLSAAQRLEPREVERLLDFAVSCMGLDATVDEVLFPALHELGTRWQLGTTDVAHEHLASQAVQAWLVRVAGYPEHPMGNGPIVLSCGPNDQHTLGLDALGVLLTHRRWDCRILGAATPATSLSRAIRETGATAAVLVSHLSANRRPAVEALVVAAEECALVFYAGAAFRSRQSRRGVPGEFLGEQLSRAADLVTERVSLASPARAPG